MADTVKVEVTNAQWACGDVEPPFVLEGGVHELELRKLRAPVRRALAAAHHAGAGVIVHEGIRSLPADVVEKDADSLAFLEKADAVRAELLADRDMAIDRRQMAIADAFADVDPDDEEAAKRRAAAIAEAVEEEVAIYEAAADELVQERLA